MSPAARQPRCPICGRRLDADGKPAETTPFCSERCRLIDLGGWLDGRYAIAAAPAENPDVSPDDYDDS